MELAYGCIDIIRLFHKLKLGLPNFVELQFKKISLSLFVYTLMFPL